MQAGRHSLGRVKSLRQRKSPYSSNRMFTVSMRACRSPMSPTTSSINCLSCALSCTSRARACMMFLYCRQSLKYSLISGFVSHGFTPLCRAFLSPALSGRVVALLHNRSLPDSAAIVAAYWFDSFAAGLIAPSLVIGPSRSTRASHAVAGPGYAQARRNDGATHRPRRRSPVRSQAWRAQPAFDFATARR